MTSDDEIKVLGVGKGRGRGRPKKKKKGGKIAKKTKNAGKKK